MDLWCEWSAFMVHNYLNLLNNALEVSTEKHSSTFLQLPNIFLIETSNPLSSQPVILYWNKESYDNTDIY